VGDEAWKNILKRFSVCEILDTKHRAPSGVLITADVHVCDHEMHPFPLNSLCILSYEQFHNPTITWHPSLQQQETVMQQEMK
jgi:hypothetical protein